jgi:predicted nucleotidyltransferase
MIDPRLEQIASAQPFPLVFSSVSGAHLYGFESLDSDWDLRGVHVLPPDEVVGLDTGPLTVQDARMQEDLELDLVTHDVLKFCKLLLKRNGYVLEQLYSPLVVTTTESHEELRSIAQNCITSNTRHHYRGFAQTEWKLFEKSGFTALKPLLYVFRVLRTGIHLIRTGVVEANLVHLLDEHPRFPYFADLINEKRSKGERSAVPDLDVDRVEADVGVLYEALEKAGLDSRLPAEPTAYRALHDFVVRVRLGQLEVPVRHDP